MNVIKGLVWVFVSMCMHSAHSAWKSLPKSVYAGVSFTWPNVMCDAYIFNTRIYTRLALYHHSHCGRYTFIYCMQRIQISQVTQSCVQSPCRSNNSFFYFLFFPFFIRYIKDIHGNVCYLCLVHSSTKCVCVCINCKWFQQQNINIFLSCGISVSNLSIHR